MPDQTYLNIEYILYYALLFFKESFIFIINMPWLKIYFWARIVGGAIILLFLAGIIYNVIATGRSGSKK